MTEQELMTDIQELIASLLETSEAVRDAADVWAEIGRQFVGELDEKG